MSSFHTTQTRKAYWDPVIAAPTKTTTMVTPSLPVTSSSSSSSSSSSFCWDWLLFSPEYYEFYTPSSTHVHYQQQKVEEEIDNDIGFNLLASLPACLLALLCLTPKLILRSDDENDSDQEISSLHIADEPLLPTLSVKNIDEIKTNISSTLLLSSDNKINTSNLNIDDQNCKEKRSSTPDTDDGYQSATDASRSDYSQQSSIIDDHHNSKDDITMTKHCLPTSLAPRRITYAAAVKPIASSTNKILSSPMMITKPKQTNNNTLSTTMTTSTSNTKDMVNSKGQKIKFIAPRFERMHHAKQSSSISSNRNQARTNNNNNNQRANIINSTRRR